MSTWLDCGRRTCRTDVGREQQKKFCKERSHFLGTSSVDSAKSSIDKNFWIKCVSLLVTSWLSLNCMRQQLHRRVPSREYNCLLLYSVSFRLISPGLIRPTDTSRVEKRGSEWHCLREFLNLYISDSLVTCQTNTIARRHVIQILSQWEGAVIEGLISTIRRSSYVRVSYSSENISLRTL